MLIQLSPSTVLKSFDMFKFYFKSHYPVHSICIESSSLFKAMKELSLIIGEQDVTQFVSKVVHIKSL